MSSVPDHCNKMSQFFGQAVYTKFIFTLVENEDYYDGFFNTLTVASISTQT